MTLAKSRRYKKYDPVVDTTDFEVGFPLFGNDDLRVLVDGVETSAFSLNATFVRGRANDASIELVTAVSGVPVEIFGARSPRRDSEYLPTSPGLAENLQRDADALTAVQQEQARDWEDTIKLTGLDSEARLRARPSTVIGIDSEGELILFPASTATVTDEQLTRVVMTDDFFGSELLARLRQSGNLASRSDFARRNAVINGGFAVNQREVSGVVNLVAGDYGHDRWKAGADGCTYTFATVENKTTITITSGSLIQPIEGLNLFSGTYTLSWDGTAEARVQGGEWSAETISTAIVGGTDLSLEFRAGTLSQVQFERGDVVTSFEQLSYDEELRKCLRYCQVYDAKAFGVITIFGNGIAESSEAVRGAFHLIAPMRVVPTVTLSDLGDFRIYTTGDHKFNSGAGGLEARSNTMCAWNVSSVSGSMVPGQAGQIMAQNQNATITLEAEL